MRVGAAGPRGDMPESTFPNMQMLCGLGRNRGFGESLPEARRHNRGVATICDAVRCAHELARGVDLGRGRRERESDGGDDTTLHADVAHEGVGGCTPGEGRRGAPRRACERLSCLVRELARRAGKMNA